MYRLEKTSDVPCDLGDSAGVPGAGRPEQLEFRVGGNGDFYLITYEAGKIWRFDSTGKLIRAVSTGAFLYRHSAGFARSPEGDLFVLDGRQKKLYRYDASLDLIGKYPLLETDELEPIYGFAATSWGDLLVSGGLKSGIWRLEPEGQGFSAKSIYMPETHRYSFLSEIGERRLLATDPLGALLILDRFGNLLKTFSFEKGLRATAIGQDFLVTVRPYTEITLLDSAGAVLANWQAADLDSAFKKVFDFQVVRDRAYFLLPSLDRVLVFRLARPDSLFSSGRGLNE